MVRFVLALLVAVIGAGPVHAQSSGAAADTTEERSADWLLLPYASYALDTKIAGGLVVGYYRPEQPEGAASNVQSTFTVTQRRQIIIEVAPELYLGDGLWRAQGVGQVSHYPNSYFGVGGDTPQSAEESYTARYVLLDLTAQRRLRPNLRVGPRLFVRGDAVRDPEDEAGDIAQGRVAGADGGLTAGLGLSFFWDARNSLYYPTGGTYAEIVTTLHSAAWGSDYTFGRVETDLRGYRSLGIGVLTGQIYTESVVGTAPFQLLPLLGGSSRMRGYREGRFRDNVYWTAQAEYRIPLFWRFKATAFASVGEVGPRVGPELVEEVEVAVGIGGRLRLTDDGVHGRLDLAWSPTGIAPTISLGEAF